MWAELRTYLFSRPLNLLLICVPLLVIMEFAHLGGPTALFIISALAIVPLAGVLGDATEEVAGRMGPVAGGLLSGTLGNATELIIALLAIRAGEIEVVKASITGSILGNLLLVLGLSILAGGLGREKQVFERTHASANTSMLMLAVCGLVMPAVFDLVQFHTLTENTEVQQLSLWTAGVLLLTYLASFVFSFRTHKHLFTAEEHGPGSMSRRTAFTLMAVSTLLIAFASEVLVGQIEAATQALGMTKFFVGVIVVAVVGNAAEHSAAIFAARKNKMDLALTIAVGSSVQIALLVAPLLVFASHLVGHPMSLVFNGFEIAATILSVLVVALVSLDGETNWFEGVQLVAVYLILSIAFFFVPA